MKDRMIGSTTNAIHKVPLPTREKKSVADLFKSPGVFIPLGTSRASLLE